MRQVTKIAKEVSKHSERLSYKGATKVATKEEIQQKMEEKFRQKDIEMLSFFNSELDCIIDDPAYMTIPLDDRIFNRAHGIFESMVIKKFQFFSFEQHLQRLQQSSEKAGINLPYDIPKIQEIMVDIASFSYKKLSEQGLSYQELEKTPIHMRVWVSSGRKDFGIYSYGKAPIFYCATFVNHGLIKGLDKLSEGIHEFTISDVQIKRLDTVKSTSYLQNCVLADISKSQGGYQGLKLNENGQILEQSMSNVAYINKFTQEMIVTPEDHIIPGTTLKKVIENYVKPKLLKEGKIKKIVSKYFTVDEIINEASEFMGFGGDKVLPILSINNLAVGSGIKGPLCSEIQDWYKSLAVTDGDYAIPENILQKVLVQVKEEEQNQ